MEFLVRISFRPPSDLPHAARERTIAAERARAAQLVAAGHLLRIWRLPGQDANFGLWRAADLAELQGLIGSLPAKDWFTGIEAIPLAAHPSDPCCADPSGDRS